MIRILNEENYKWCIKTIDGSEALTNNYRRRVYLITQEEFEELRTCNTFVIRHSVDGEKIYKSCEYDQMYMIVGDS